MDRPGRELLAWLGPAIGPESYEVGSEVRDACLAAAPGAGSAFVPSPARKGHWLANLYVIASCQLASAGVVHTYGADSAPLPTNADSSRTAATALPDVSRPWPGCTLPAGSCVLPARGPTPRSRVDSSPDNRIYRSTPRRESRDSPRIPTLSTEVRHENGQAHDQVPDGARRRPEHRGRPRPPVPGAGARHGGAARPAGRNGASPSRSGGGERECATVPSRDRARLAASGRRRGR